MTDEKLALQVIEAICENECLRVNDIRNHPDSCFHCKIYKIAHSANVGCRPNHDKWWPATKKLHKELSG